MFFVVLFFVVLFFVVLAVPHRGRCTADPRVRKRRSASLAGARAP
jgi:hypothetical protein